MLNLGAGEIVFILVIALLVLGPQKLPELARGIGKFMREFRRQTDDVRTTVMREFYRLDQDVNLEKPKPKRPTDEELEKLYAQPPEELESKPLDNEVTRASPEELRKLSLEGQPVAADDWTPPYPAAAVAPSLSAPAAPPVAQTPAPAEPAAPGAAPAAAAAQPEEVPRLAPVPGTVARGAPRPAATGTDTPKVSSES